MLNSQFEGKPVIVMVYKVTVKVVQSLWEITHSCCVGMESYYEKTKDVMRVTQNQDEGDIYLLWGHIEELWTLQ